MKNFQLKPFADNKHDNKITGHVLVHPDHMTVHFELADPNQHVKWPALGPAIRKVGLWRETCFEFFLKSQLGPSYLEVNLSPTLAWNAFWFNAPGDELAEYPGIHQLQVLTNKNSISVNLHTNLLPPGFFIPGAMQMNISAVLKDRQNELSYWALTHPENHPNFHDFRGFILHV